QRSRPGFAGLLAALHEANRRAVLVALRPQVAVPADLDVDPRGERVHHGDANAVQAAGDRVRLTVELAARVQGGHDDLERRPLLHRVLIDGDTAPVVLHPDPAVGQQGYLDLAGVARQRLVHRVIHNLVHKVVQSALAGRADVHAGTLTDSFKALKYRDGPRIVIVRQSEAPSIVLLPAPPRGSGGVPPGSTAGHREADRRSANTAAHPRPPVTRRMTKPSAPWSRGPHAAPATGSLIHVTTFYFSGGYRHSGPP